MKKLVEGWILINLKKNYCTNQVRDNDPKPKAIIPLNVHFLCS